MYTVDICNFTSLAPFRLRMDQTYFIFSETSENINSRTQLNPGHVAEIRDCPGRHRTDGHLSRHVEPFWWLSRLPSIPVRNSLSVSLSFSCLWSRRYLRGVKGMARWRWSCAQ